MPPASPPPPRRYPIGAELLGPDRTHFRVWAPKAERLEVAVQADGNRDSVPAVVALAPEGNGYFSGEAAAGAGALYRFRLDGGVQLYPDPASRSTSARSAPRARVPPPRANCPPWPRLGLQSSR